MTFLYSVLYKSMHSLAFIVAYDLKSVIKCLAFKELL